MLAAYALYLGYIIRAMTLHLGTGGTHHLPEPCGVTWLLFAAGTALHVGVELLYGVPLRGLYADMVCGAMSAAIAVLCAAIKATAR